MKHLLNELKKTGLVKVTGSYAIGQENWRSDIDFYIKTDKPDVEVKDRNMAKIIKILNRFGIKWCSFHTGYIYTPNTIPMLEFSNLFWKKKNTMKRVNILGIEFMTF